MKNREALKERILREPMPNRFGELAAALARFATVSAKYPERPDIVVQLLNEPLCYAECLATDSAVPLQAELSEMYSRLVEWERDWQQINANEIQRRTVIKQVREWSEQMLDASGLVEERMREVA